ncbi:hypothetical protein KIW84_054020 [Lathyrus oleraceus]|uniref:Uncharacterized protein n=1 Tax=Pisum sativum TaxID=3888 RepID=A0A9D4WU99_PEA|nr:hypothetical protein KIW84_054020 [Pisum sativum]
MKKLQTQALLSSSVGFGPPCFDGGEFSGVYLFGTGGEFSVFCLCEAVWLLLGVDWLKGELLCSGKLHGLEGEYKRLISVSKPIEYNAPIPSPNFEFPVFEVEEESDEEISDELSRLLEHEEKAIQPFEEQIELVNLGSEDDVKEVKIGSRLCPEVKKGLIDLL